MLSNVMLTWPPITSVSAGGLPLYGTCCISTPAMPLNSSPERCCDVPLPLEAKFQLPGFAFMSLMSSATFLAGMSLLTTSMFGTRAISVIATKSFTGS
jgi:hypothetical protein